MSPSAPVSARSGRAKAMTSTVLAREMTRFMTTRFPIMPSMVRWSFDPMARESAEAEPIPISDARPELMNVNG